MSPSLAIPEYFPLVEDYSFHGFFLNKSLTFNGDDAMNINHGSKMFLIGMFFLSIVLLIGCIGLGIHRIRTRRRLNRLRHQLISLRELDITSDQSRKPHVATPDVFTKEPCLMVHCEVKNQTHSSVVTKLKTYDEGSLRSGKES